MKKVEVFIIVAISFFSFTIPAQNRAADIIGVWLTSGKAPAKIQIYKSCENFLWQNYLAKKPY